MIILIPTSSSHTRGTPPAIRRCNMVASPRLRAINLGCRVRVCASPCYLALRLYAERCCTLPGQLHTYRMPQHALRRHCTRLCRPDCRSTLPASNFVQQLCVLFVVLNVERCVKERVAQQLIACLLVTRGVPEGGEKLRTPAAPASTVRAPQRPKLQLSLQRG
ncbi:hypothetical protein JKP88DRAFT_236087 [Tribonema minus]|uniref:Uncharacterized protein n=1 Tax=Tribonema minus TaxID=303371 RepID=A0A835Z548_9STRA|nr:hypothetical protein JKP88DRAFT_236087 [Tribonema minus]